MKTFRKLFALCLVLALCLATLPAAFAATVPTATIDTSRPASLSLYKYDFTTANADGVLELDSYVSTGLPNEAVEQALSAYAIQGVVFSYVKVADIVTYYAKEADSYKNMVLYRMTDSTKTAQLLSALGLTNADAYRSEAGTLDFTSDTLNRALSTKLEENASALKNALEQFAAGNGGANMPETGANGHSEVGNLEQGLYLLVETYVPEDVSNTTAPFLTSLPMTTIDGADWNYDVTIYPKNETDRPNLEKTLRESKPDTGKHNGSADDITDGYAHTGTGSDGDVIDYQIISTLPTITSNATALTTYTFADTLTKGIEYNRGDVKLEWFQDAACTEKITQWTENSGKFAVEYGTAIHDSTTMTISMTAAGLDEINNAASVYDASSLYRGYSGCTVRITYACTVNSSADVVYGDDGNPNTVTLTWKRTNTSYFDTLTDDCHLYVYAIDLTKKFSDELGNFAKVQFAIHNDTDGYFVLAQWNEAESCYYVTGHAAEEAKATKFVPNQNGQIIVKGLEDDAYTLTELQTDSGYTLLKDAIQIVITSQGDGEFCPVCGKEGVTATATVNGDTVAMQENNGSLRAIVPLTVVNTKSFDLPQTGDNGALILTISGVTMLLCAAGCIIYLLASKRRQHS